MNILIDKLPTNPTINGKSYGFNTDFRSSIYFSIIMQDDSLSEEDKLYKALEIYYPIIPFDVEKALDYIYWFYSCGKTETEIDTKQVKEGKKLFKRNNNRAYDFEVDSDLIFTAFMTQYNINLAREDLHWWEFMALFNGLKEDNEIVKIMNYRTINLNSIEDKKERKLYSDLQKYYSLENKVSKEEQTELEELRAKLEALEKGGKV